MASDEAHIAELIHRAQVYISPRRIRSREFFVNFDPLRSGRCTKVQFGRGLETAGIKMTDMDVEFLAEHFTQDGPNVQKPQVVSYKAFCDAVDKIFAEEDQLEFRSTSMSQGFGDRGMSPSNSMMMTSMSSFSPQPVDDEEMERLDHVMHRLAALCKSRGIVFKYLYHDIDRGPSPSPSNMNPRRGGKVTASQFKRLFPFKKEMVEDDIDLIVKRYSTPKGDVNFQAIHSDVSEVLAPEPPPFPTSPLHLKPDGTQWDHMTLNPVTKIQSKVVERRIRLKEYFADVDPLRKGFCTAGQLKTIFTILNLSKDVTKDDFNHLIANYSRDDGMFCYSALCSHVDEAFSRPGLEKDPMATTPLPDATTTAPGRRNRMTLSGSERKKINAVEDKIKQRIRVRRILMKPSFQDMDRAHKGLVTRNQFQRVMGTLGFELSQQEFSLLAGYYCDRGNHNDFNYVDFIKANDPPIEAEEIAMSQLNAPYQDQADRKSVV